MLRDLLLTALEKELSMHMDYFEIEELVDRVLSEISDVLFA